MRRLIRALASSPLCLEAYSHPAHTWDNVSGPCMESIHRSLDKVQAGRCAYCEGPLEEGKHVEHFSPKGRFPALTFEWTNLFQSCQSYEHCGHYKDRPATSDYDPADLVKPDVHEPDDFLLFYRYGAVDVKPGIDLAAVQRALETIRIFHLDEGGLRAERRLAVDRYLQNGGLILEGVMTLPAADRAEWIRAEIADTRDALYCTTIRHFLERQ